MTFTSAVLETRNCCCWCSGELLFLHCNCGTKFGTLWKKRFLVDKHTYTSNGNVKGQNLLCKCGVPIHQFRISSYYMRHANGSLTHATPYKALFECILSLSLFWRVGFVCVCVCVSLKWAPLFHCSDVVTVWAFQSKYTYIFIFVLLFVFIVGACELLLLLSLVNLVLLHGGRLGLILLDNRYIYIL